MRIKLGKLRKLIREFAADEEMGLESAGRYLDYDMPEEGLHAKGHLFHAAADAKKLHDILEDGDTIPSWCLEYIALSRHSISIVHDYLSYKINRN